MNSSECINLYLFVGMLYVPTGKTCVCFNIFAETVKIEMAIISPVYHI